MRIASPRQALRHSGVLVLCCLFGSRVGIAQGPPPLGEEFQVNTYTTGSQGDPAVARDPGGGFVIVWSSSAYQGGSPSGVIGRRYDAAGEPVGGEFQVNTHTTGGQFRPAIAADASGNFVVVWTSSPQDGSGEGIFGQRFDAAGDPVGEEFQVNTYTTSDQTFPRVAADASGDFLVVWQSHGQDGSDNGVFGQRYDAGGDPAGEEFRVNTYTTDHQSWPAVAADAAGNFVVVWKNSLDHYGFFGAVLGQRYDAAGRPVGEEFQVNDWTAGTPEPAVAADAAGNFVVVWSSYFQDGSYDGIIARRYDAAGNRLGEEFVVNSHTSDFQFGPAVAVDASGDFVVVWHSWFQDGSLEGVFGQYYDASGAPLGSEFQVNTHTIDAQTAPTVAVDAFGNFVVVWDSSNQDGSGSGTFGQRFLAPVIFDDGFESGDATAWDQTVP